MSNLYNPLIESPSEEICLTRAPLIRVIAQVRFPKIISIEQKGFLAPFQEAIRATYPILREEQLSAIMMKGGIGTLPTQTIWRFSNVEESWRISLTSEFIAIESTAYKSRTDFLERFKNILTALEDHVDPTRIDRFGIRYINRIIGDSVNRIPNLVNPSIQGILGSPVEMGAHFTLTESLFKLSNGSLFTRWGKLSPLTTVDPGIIEPLNEVSWILDFDMFNDQPAPFVIKNIMENASSFTERIYAFFRWAVTSQYLKTYE